MPRSVHIGSDSDAAADGGQITTINKSFKGKKSSGLLAHGKGGKGQSLTTLDPLGQSSLKMIHTAVMGAAALPCSPRLVWRRAQVISSLCVLHSGKDNGQQNKGPLIKDIRRVLKENGCSEAALLGALEAKRDDIENVRNEFRRTSLQD